MLARATVVGSALVLAGLGVGKAWTVGAIVFYGLAAVLVVGSGLVMAGRLSGLVMLVIVFLIWLVAEGPILMRGIPTEPLADAFVVGLGVPLAAIGLAGTAALWRRRSVVVS